MLTPGSWGVCAAAATSCSHSGHVTVCPVIKDTRGPSFFVAWFKEVDSRAAGLGALQKRTLRKWERVESTVVERPRSNRK